MFAECVRVCPPEHWDDPVAKYPFWQVVYHTLYCTETYLTADEETYVSIVEDRVSRRAQGEDVPDFQPEGMKELEEEYPSRRFSQEEMVAYVDHCMALIGDVFRPGGNDTPLDGPSGFPWVGVPRFELHIYNIRHIQHHTGQLAALLRRIGIPTHWVKAGRPDAG